MNEFFEASAYFGVIISLFSYMTGVWLKKKFKLAIFNPLLISIVFTAVFLLVFKIDYKIYNSSAKYLSYLLTPATVCLAIPLYEKFELLKKNKTAIVLGISSGVLTSLLSVLAFSVLLKLNHTEYVTLLPKSITTAVGMGVSEELGGYISVTVAVIIVTGVTGNVIAESVCKLFKITEPIAKGVAIGTSSHAIGTTKAMEMGETEGAMSSLSIVVSSVLTVVAAAVFAKFF